MKDWRKVRRQLGKMFDHDYVHYHKIDDYVEIRSNSFIGVELYNLFIFCKEHRLWYYLDVANNRDIIIRVEKI